MKKTKKLLSFLLCILITATFMLSTMSVSAQEIDVDQSSASLELIRFSRMTIKLGVGETYTFSKDFIQRVIAGTNMNSYRWGSGNEKVATVDNNGKIVAKNVGETYITLLPNDCSYLNDVNMGTPRCKVVVKKAPTYVDISLAKVTLGLGEEVGVYKSINSDAYAGTFTWSSDNNNIATVEQTSFDNARIVAKGVGTTKIRIKTYNNKIDTCSVTVKQAPTSITINAPSTFIGLGESVTIKQSTDSGSYSNKIYWSSSDSNVLSVKKTSNTNAVITANKLGTATISVKTFNTITDNLTFTVKKAPDSVSLDKKELYVCVGETVNLTGNVNSGSFANTFNWTTSNSSVAAVSSTTTKNATITAKATGTADIKISTYNGKTDTCKVTVYKDTHEKFVNEVLRLTNIEREKYGKAPLKKRTDVDEMANIRAEEISRLFNHTRPNGVSWSSLLKELSIKYKTAGENIAAGQYTPEDVVSAWMNSPGHRKNILNANFTGLGVGYYYNQNLHYKHYWVQNFIG